MPGAPVHRQQIRIVSDALENLSNYIFSAKFNRFQASRFNVTFERVPFQHFDFFENSFVHYDFRKGGQVLIYFQSNALDELSDKLRCERCAEVAILLNILCSIVSGADQLEFR
jgi:hypothetical protein